MKEALEKRCMVVSVSDIDPLFTNILIPVIVASLSAIHGNTGLKKRHCWCRLTTHEASVQ